MNRTELESKALAELHELAAKAQVPRYRMLRKAELIEKLLDDDGGAKQGRDVPAPAPAVREEAPAQATPQAEPAGAEEKPRRPRRRRRRFGRRAKQLSVHKLLLPPSGGRQVLVHAESREACTALLRSVAAELGGESKGPDPIALLIDPSPEEIAEWRRVAPKAEIVAAGQPRHADDALGQAGDRAKSGEDVILLVDSLSRLAEAYRDADAAREYFDAAGAASGSGGSLTVVAAVERSGEKT